MAGYIVHMTLTIAPGRQDAFETMMCTEAPLTRAYDGCELFEVYAGPNPGEIIFLEHWRSHAASEAYTKWRTDRGDMARLGAFFAAAPKTMILRRVEA